MPAVEPPGWGRAARYALRCCSPPHLLPLCLLLAAPAVAWPLAPTPPCSLPRAPPAASNSGRPATSAALPRARAAWSCQRARWARRNTAACPAAPAAACTPSPGTGNAPTAATSSEWVCGGGLAGFWGPGGSLGALKGCRLVAGRLAEVGTCHLLLSPTSVGAAPASAPAPCCPPKWPPHRRCRRPRHAPACCSFQRRENCNQCGKAKPENAAEAGLELVADPGLQPGQMARPGDWRCTSCNNIKSVRRRWWWWWCGAVCVCVCVCVCRGSSHPCPAC